MSKKIKVDPFPTTVLPFVYNSKEWDKPPMHYLYAFMRKSKINRFRIIHEGDPETGYLSSIILCGHKFFASTYFETKDKARENVIILALLNCLGYCDSAEELQNKVYTNTKSISLSKSYDSIFVEDASHANKYEHLKCKEVILLPKVERLSLTIGSQVIPIQDENLRMDQFEIDGILFKADKEKVTVNINNISCLNNVPPKKIINLGHYCYEIPYMFYEKHMGRASWVFNIMYKNKDPVHVHPSIIFANEENSIQLKYTRIPNEKSLKDYHTVSHHFVMLVPLTNELYTCI